MKSLGYTRISKPLLMDACVRVVKLASEYKPAEHHREMGYDGLLFGYLDGRFGKMKRQHQVKIGKSRHPKRIDFRQGGVSPVMIEFVVRTPGRNEIDASQNRREVQKLARQRKATARYLLLLDLSGDQHVEIEKLRSKYRELNSGRGRFERKAVKVIYVHPDHKYSFTIKP
jgi:hypothetical protein